MAGYWQLDPPPGSTVDGAVMELMDDGTYVTTFPDGTSRVDYPDGSAMITYPDFAVLNLYTDGTRTLTDAAGTPYDPWSGAPLEDLEGPKYGAAEIQYILAGGEILGTLRDAKELVDAARDSVRGAVDPTSWMGQVMNAILEVIGALETEERGCFYRGWSYALLYGAQDLGAPPVPAFGGSLAGAGQDELNRLAWSEGSARGQSDLADGSSGTALRNKVLIQVALDGGDARSTLQKTYKAACESSEDWQLAEGYADILTWPETLGA